MVADYLKRKGSSNLPVENVSIFVLLKERTEGVNPNFTLNIGPDKHEPSSITEVADSERRLWKLSYNKEHIPDFMFGNWLLSGTFDEDCEIEDVYLCFNITQ